MSAFGLLTDALSSLTAFKEMTRNGREQVHQDVAADTQLADLSGYRSKDVGGIIFCATQW